MRTPTSIALIVAFAVLMAAGAQITVPMTPVPMTMQTFAVLLAGAVLGPLRGAGSVLLYLASAALGLPVLSDGAGGLAPFAGATAGYLFAFPVAAVLAGYGARRTSDPRWAGDMVTMISAHLFILGVGALWLSTRIGPGDAADAGFTPFLTGMVVKSALVVAVLMVLRRLKVLRPDQPLRSA